MYMIKLELDVIFYINGFTNESVWYQFVLEAGYETLRRVYMKDYD